jgi:transposase
MEGASLNSRGPIQTVSKLRGENVNEADRLFLPALGVGPAQVTALVASVADPKVFRSGRDFSAWIGLVPPIREADIRRPGKRPAGYKIAFIPAD